MDLWHILNVAKWRCGKVAIKREQSQARLCYAEREPLRRCQSDKQIRNLLCGDCGRGEINKPSVQMASGPWPMQLVVPRAVRAAVRIDTMT